jgi:hypothetical protein
MGQTGGFAASSWLVRQVASFLVSSYSAISASRESKANGREADLAFVYHLSVFVCVKKMQSTNLSLS